MNNFVGWPHSDAHDCKRTLGARGLSCAVSGLGQCLYCDIGRSSAGKSRSGPRETSGTQGSVNENMARTVLC